MDLEDFQQPWFPISIVSHLLDMHPQTIRHYEKLGLIEPRRSEGGVRLFSQMDVERLKKIKMFTQEMGINLAGVEVIFSLLDKLSMLEMEMERKIREMEKQFEEEIKLLKKELQEFDK